MGDAERADQQRSQFGQDVVRRDCASIYLTVAEQHLGKFMVRLGPNEEVSPTRGIDKDLRHKLLVVRRQQFQAEVFVEALRKVGNGGLYASGQPHQWIGDKIRQ